MKRASSKIRAEIAKLQEQLKAAETREAERIGRLALRAGLGAVAIEDTDLVAAFEEITDRFRRKGPRAERSPSASVASGPTAGPAGEA